MWSCRRQCRRVYPQARTGGCGCLLVLSIAKSALSCRRPAVVARMSRASPRQRLDMRSILSQHCLGFDGQGNACNAVIEELQRKHYFAACLQNTKPFHIERVDGSSHWLIGTAPRPQLAEYATAGAGAASGGEGVGAEELEGVGAEEHTVSRRRTPRRMTRRSVLHGSRRGRGACAPSSPPKHTRRGRRRVRRGTPTSDQE